MKCRLLMLSLVFGATLLVLSLSACSRSEGRNKNTQAQDEQLQQQVADATQKVREEGKQLNQQAEEEAQRLKQQAKAIKEGVKEGWNRNDQGKTVVIDVNSASEAQLDRLPGIGPSDARRIINGRPYNSPHDLLAKGILSGQQYEQVRDSITAK